MDFEVFKRIARTFADEGFEAKRNALVFVARDELFDIRVEQREGTLVVLENEVTVPAGRWLATRLARLPLLADRILQHCAADPNFIAPEGDAVLSPEHPDAEGYGDDDPEVFCSDVPRFLSDLLGWRPAGTCSVLYLTSEGGEGKTTVTNHLAVLQARAFKQGSSPWLLLPVELGGRPFIRLDEVSTSTLVNKLRFPYLYYDALIEFCRLGYIVLAIDGFEEMFIEDPSGDATSSLGRLLDSMESEGRVLISARKAFFEFHNLQDQTLLYDSIRNQSVAFSRIALRRWSKDKFLLYCERRGVPDAEQLFTEIAASLKDERHPLLTRPVLVRRLLDLVQDGTVRDEFVTELQAAPTAYLDTLIQAVVQRESSKWVDRTTEPSRPLLTVQEHFGLLREVAMEMWRSGTRALRVDTLTLVAELYADSTGKPPTVKHRVVKWAPQHALLTKRDERFVEFDHEEIYAYFLGQAIASEVANTTAEDLRVLLTAASLPAGAVSMWVPWITDMSSAVTKLQEVGRREGPTSLAMDNCTRLLARLLEKKREFETVIERLTFPSNAFSGGRLGNLRFRACNFARMHLRAWTNVHFESCTIDELRIMPEAHVVSSTIDTNSSVAAVSNSGGEFLVFDPKHIRQRLTQVGLRASAVEGPAVAPDAQLALVEKCIQIFMRSTELNEGSLRKRFGSRAAAFVDGVLPDLERHAILKEVGYRGAGQQRRFALRAPLDRLARALAQSGGDFRTFLEVYDQLCTGV